MDLSDIAHVQLARAVHALTVLLLIAWLGSLLRATHQQVGRWQDERGLWVDAVHLAPQKPRPWANVAEQDAHRGHVLVAVAEYRHALALAEQRPIREASLATAVIRFNLQRLSWHLSSSSPAF